MTDQTATIDADELANAAELDDDDDESYLESVRRFIRSATWLGEEHRPAMKVLRSLAKVLDDELARGKAPQAALVSQFGLTYRDLAKLGQKPAGDDASDPSMPPPMGGIDW